MTALHLAVTRAATHPDHGHENGRGDDSTGGPDETLSASLGLRGGCVHALLAAGASIELEDYRKLCERRVASSQQCSAAQCSAVQCSAIPLSLSFDLQACNPTTYYHLQL
jgi:hypothetical protein